jgi:16S rRNA (cytosine967-C5)-methyltransferase
MQNISSNPSNTPFSARQCAVELLAQILDHKRPFDEAVTRFAALQRLSERDRNFARLLVMTCLRRLGQIDALLAKLLAKPLQGKSQHVMHCLRLGVVQLIWLETPAHAAVHAMVETVAELGYENMKGLVNAVLKRVANEGMAIIEAQDEVKDNVPDWLYASWQKVYGDETARVIAAARLLEPSLDVTVKDNVAEWAEKLGGTLLPTGSIRIVDAGRVDALPGYDEGKWWVQDAAASLPVQLLGDVRGKIILDLCAAPGGKTAQLAANGAQVIVLDKSKRRLQLLQSNMERLQLDVQMIEGDILKWKPTIEPDAILLDAPCSATGTLRRHPEMVWHKKKEDIEELVILQKTMLNRVVRWLKPGGLLVYCVCSLQPQEGEEQIANFLESHPEFISLDVSGWNKNIIPFIGKNHAIRTHPGVLAPFGGMDGFYAICLQRLNDS